jgi:integrase/recombinase XerD
MPPKGWRKRQVGDATDPEGLVVWSRRHLEHLRVRGYSERGLRTRESHLGLFVEWCFHRGITKPTEVSKPILERYQRHVFYIRQKSGKPLSFSAQRQRMQVLVVFFKWLARENVILANPASELEMPRVPRALPRAVLSEKEIEKVMATPDPNDAIGLRDRAIMEVLYSTGIRRFELTGLLVFDVDHERGTVLVRLGKGRKDRVVPIGERALKWVRRYLDEVRTSFVVSPDEGFLFLSETGERIDDPHLTHIMRRYLLASGVNKKGAVHIFRHSMATLMLEGGADVRVIQQILGHVELSTTEIYTRVSIKHAKAVHEMTHPGAKVRRRRKPSAPKPEATEQELLKALEAEEDEDTGDEIG